MKRRDLRLAEAAHPPQEGLIDLRRGRGAVVTATDPVGDARLRSLVADLVTEARLTGTTPTDLTRLIESEFQK